MAQDARTGIVARIADYFLFPPDAPIVQARVGQCVGCPKSGFLPGAQALAGEKARQCGVCSCFVYAKARKRNERCPLGKW